MQLTLNFHKVPQLDLPKGDYRITRRGNLVREENQEYSSSIAQASVIGTPEVGYRIQFSHSEEVIPLVIKDAELFPKLRNCQTLSTLVQNELSKMEELRLVQLQSKLKQSEAINTSDCNIC